MNYFYCVLLFAPLLFMSGCSSTSKEKVDTGAVSAHTFSFVSTGPLAGTDDREPVHRMIQGAITRNLSSKGVTRSSSGSDVTVAYLIVRGNHVATEVVSDHFGYSADAQKLAEKAHDAYTGSASRGYFEAGTLLIDIVDSRTNKLLKRGYATSPLLKNLPVSDRNAAVQQAADSILSGLRITH